MLMPAEKRCVLEAMPSATSFTKGGPAVVLLKGKGRLSCMAFRRDVH